MSICAYALEQSGQVTFLACPMCDCESVECTARTAHEHRCTSCGLSSVIEDWDEENW